MVPSPLCTSLSLCLSRHLRAASCAGCCQLLRLPVSLMCVPLDRVREQDETRQELTTQNRGITRNMHANASKVMLKLLRCDKKSLRSLESVIIIPLMIRITIYHVSYHVQTESQICYCKFPQNATAEDLVLVKGAVPDTHPCGSPPRPQLCLITLFSKPVGSKT